MQQIHLLTFSATLVAGLCIAGGAPCAEEGAPFELRQLTSPDIEQVLVSDTSDRRFKGRRMFEAKALIDGRLWSAWGSEQSSGSWVEVRFSTVRYITRVQLMPVVNDKRLPRWRRPKKIDITWDGGTQEHLLDDIQALTTLEFPQALITSRLRIKVVGAWGHSGPMALGELLMFEPEDIFALKPELRQDIEVHIGELRDRHTRDKAIARLEAIGNPAITWLTLTIADTDPLIREGATLALHHIGTAIAAEPVAKAVRSVLNTPQSWQNPDEIAFMRAALIYLGGLRSARGAQWSLALYRHPQWRSALGTSLIRCIAETGHPDGIGALQEALRGETDSAVAAMPGFVNLGEQGAKTLNRFAFSREPHIRLHVAQALQHWKSHEVMPSIRTLARDPSPAVRAQLYRSLGIGGHSRGEHYAQSGTRDSDIVVRLAAIEALGAWTTPSALATLKTMSRDQDPRVRMTAIQALEHHQSEALEPLVILLATETRLDVRHEAERILRRLGPKHAQRLLKRLEQELDSDHPKYAQRAAHLMTGCGQQGIERLMAVMESEENTRRSFYARRALQARPDEATHAITQRLNTRPTTAYNTTLLTQYVQILGASDNPEVVLPLVRLISDPRPMLRAEVMRALSRFNTLESRRAVVQGLRDHDGRVREQAAMAAGELRARRAVPALMVLVEREDEVMLRAIRALGQIRDERAMDVLHGLLDHERPTVRQYACDALGELGRSESLALLIELLEDKDEMVRNKAIRAVERIH
ncbi:MAG: HEAT repeat domain-containing protein [Myxococcota bacterium]